MHRRSLLALAASSLALLTLGVPGLRADEYRVTGPVIHENLAIYLVHGKSAAGAVPLTLDEALGKRAVKVHETGNVNELQIENLGDDDVFVQSGSIVKGGQQDRVLTSSLLLPPRSGRINIASFCVEQGRWTARGKEDVKTFATASAVVPSREAKIAMKAPTASPAKVQPDRADSLAGEGRASYYYAADVSARQQEVWNRVRKVQDGLSSSLGAPVNAAASQSSLQLALENQKLQDAQAPYRVALQDVANKESDVIGYVFAVNGKLNSAEIYPSNALFRKMWPNLMQASIVEAIGAKDAARDATPAKDAALAFLDEATKGPLIEKPLTKDVRLETRVGEKAFYFETRRTGGDWVHRSYLAK
jgi:hypothetical protein